MRSILAAAVLLVAFSHAVFARGHHSHMHHAGHVHSAAAKPHR